MNWLQLALTERSVNVAPGDGWSWVQHADALVGMQRLNEAQRAYDQAIAFGAGVVASGGRAHVLKAQGHLEAALAAFDEVILEYPENVILKIGRAEVLKDLGRLEEALAVFEEVIKYHPQNVVAKMGRAEVLKTQGQFDAALAAFDEVIQKHPEDVVAKTGRAEVLKAQGRFEAALTAFEEIMRDHPENVVAKNGRASILVGLHRYKEALQFLPRIPPVDSQDWIAYQLRGMIPLRVGQTVEAIGIFNAGLRNSPFPSNKEHFRGALALSLLRNRDFRKASETLDAVTSPLLQPSANVIRIHAFGALGDRQRAFQAYKNLEATPHMLTDELTQELHHQYVLQEQPTKDEEWVFDREVRILLRAAE